MVDREALHEAVAGLNIGNWHVRALLHVFIDAGKVTALECQWEDCPMESRRFAPRTPGQGHQGASLTIDHIHPQRQGGSDRFDNLRIVHADCNVRRAAGWKMSAEARAKIGAASREREAWRKAKAAWTPECCLKTRPDDRRGGNRPPMFTPEQAEEIRARYAEGARYIDLAAAYGTNITTIMHVVRRMEAYSEAKIA